MLERYVKKIIASRVYDVAVETPLQKAAVMSARVGNEVFLKREDLQSVFSFKIRGSYNKMAQLSQAQKQRGVVTASAGNHAQGVAMAARKLGLKAHIVMGCNTPEIKIDAVKRFGARVILHGDSYDDAAAHAKKLQRQNGYIWVHAYDDVDVIAGQGTIGMEILNQHSSKLDAIFVPVGGGGLIAGIGAYIKYLKPRVQIIGVEAEGSACLAAALKAHRRVTLPYDTLDLFADGVSVAQVGKETFKIAQHCVDGVVTVNSDEICAAVKDIFDDTRAIAEPAGALAMAGLKKYVASRGLKDKNLVAIVSGANVNFDRLRHISERAEVGEKREAILAVSIPEKTGSFRKFCRTLGKRGITEFNYRYKEADNANLYLGVKIDSEQSLKSVIETLREAGYPVQNMTDNEVAKLHVRHMVGGRGLGKDSELLYRFEFPERPGALMQFLLGLGAQWNITIFNYRNHGAAWGRVLVGFEASSDDRRRLREFLGKIGYRYWEETENPAYWTFLR